MAFLDIVELTKWYGATKALDRVSLQVTQGEMFGLLGPNGAGKTTLLSIVSCLLGATSGQVRLQGQPLERRRRRLRRLIGIVPQELAIYGELTARENLWFFGELYGLGGSQLHQQVEEILAAIGLLERANDRVDTFSGGMKRRLNLGAALVHRPRLVLLDEPTTGVDPQSRNHIFTEVRRLNAEGVTVVYTSHYMEEVQALCSRIGIMDQGRLIACDTLPSLLQKLPSVIRFAVPAPTAALRQRLRQLPEVHVPDGDDSTIELHCRDARKVLGMVVSLLNECQTEITSLEMEEPNLERVFLHLTGHGLRD